MTVVDIPTPSFGDSGIQVSVIAPGGARMDLHPDVPTAAAPVRGVRDLSVTYFDCARSGAARPTKRTGSVSTGCARTSS